MNLHVELVGPMRRPWPEQKRDLEVEEGITVGSLLQETLGFSESEARHLSVRINGSRARHTAALHEGDQVMVLLIVGGG